MKTPQYINANGRLMDLSEPQVMGILNVTPDSFYAGSHGVTEGYIIDRIHQIMNEGASIIDIGACSTRPGADEVSIEVSITIIGRTPLPREESTWVSISERRRPSDAN